MFSVSAALLAVLRPVGRRAGRVRSFQKAPQTGQLYSEGEEKADQDRGVPEDRRYGSWRREAESLQGVENTRLDCVWSN